VTTATAFEAGHIRKRFHIARLSPLPGAVDTDEDEPAQPIDSGPPRCQLPECGQLIPRRADGRPARKTAQTCCTSHAQRLRNLRIQWRYDEILEDYDHLCDARVRLYEIPGRLGFESASQLGNWLYKREGRQREANVWQGLFRKESVCWADLPDHMRAPRRSTWDQEIDAWQE
jgi:hypothetical protein